jgi:hippurate hydrolase
MHACGHDLHMTVWLGAATALARLQDRWSGTLVMIAQPAEEIGQGAAAMLADGLFRRFPRPDFALALHDIPEQAAGTVGITPGPVMASVDSVDVRVYGRGGHGALPHRTVDPVVIAARLVLALQTLVSRENDPFDPAVVTVGAIHGGSKHNIIPDEVHLQLTVRAYRPEVRARLLAGIERIARAEAMAAAAPREPEVRVSEGIPPTVNDAALADRVGAALRRGLGPERVVAMRPLTAGEDFGLYGQEGVPSLLASLGTTPAAELERVRSEGGEVPGLHSPRFAPTLEPSLTTGASALALAAIDLLGQP